MVRSISIAVPEAGESLDSTLQHAMRILRSKGVMVVGGARYFVEGNATSVTVLLQEAEDRPQVLEILDLAGIQVAN